MGHITSKNAYKSLEERINWFTQGAPASETFYKILQVLFTEKEAKVMAMLPVRPFTVKRAARIWNTSEAKAEKVLDHLCEKALLVDSSYEGVRRFVIPPPMAGFIEFALMRTRGDIDQKYLAELYYQYMNVEEDFVKDLFYATETKLGRVYVQEPVLTNEHMNHILDYERATHIIEEAKYIGLGLCYCRHKAYHAGHPCEIDAPWDVSDIWQCRPLSGGAWTACAADFQRRGEGCAGTFLCGKSGTDRRKRKGSPGVYLQLLRMLLRSASGGEKICSGTAGGNHQLYSKGDQ